MNRERSSWGVGRPSGVVAAHGGTTPTYAAVPSGAKFRTTGGDVVAMASADTKLKCLSANCQAGAPVGDPCGVTCAAGIPAVCAYEDDAV